MAPLAALVAGLIFGLGILISGMGNPAKVQNFFDVFGTWDPSLAFVMGGGLLVTLVGYRLAMVRARPIFDTDFHLPLASAIDLPLVAGAAIFGVGWGLSGFCPGGLLPVLGLGYRGPYVFLAGMLAGIVIARMVRTRHKREPAAPLATL